MFLLIEWMIAFELEGRVVGVTQNKQKVNSINGCCHDKPTSTNKIKCFTSFSLAFFCIFLVT